MWLCFDEIYCADGMSPERNLLACVMERAIRDLINLTRLNPGDPGANQIESYAYCAARWFLSSRKETLHDFESICEELDLEADEIRLQMLQRGLFPKKFLCVQHIGRKDR